MVAPPPTGMSYSLCHAILQVRGPIHKCVLFLWGHTHKGFGDIDPVLELLLGVAVAENAQSWMPSLSILCLLSWS